MSPGSTSFRVPAFRVPIALFNPLRSSYDILYLSQKASAQKRFVIFLGLLPCRNPPKRFEVLVVDKYKPRRREI